MDDKGSKKRTSREPLDQSTIETAWDNPEDEKASKFYKKHLKGK